MTNAESENENEEFISLGEVRSELGLTRRHLANRAGIAEITIYEIEIGKRVGSRRIWLKIVAALNDESKLQGKPNIYRVGDFVSVSPNKPWPRKRKHR